MISVTMLGTAAGAPTVERGHPGIAIAYRGEVLLFDCGENAQVKLLQSGVRCMRCERIFITHFHGDHFFGLPGLLFSMSLAERTEPVTLYGPRGARTEFKRVVSMGHQTLGFPVEVEEVGDGVVHSTPRYRVEAAAVSHSCPAVAYAFVEERRFRIDRSKAEALGLGGSPLLSHLQAGEEVEHMGRTVRPEDVSEGPIPGRRVVYSGDTRPCPALLELARGADLLIHEATYAAADAERARTYLHATTVEAAELAQKAGAKRLVLTHISKRYDDAAALLAEARAVFPDAVVAEDLMTLEV